MIKTEQIIVSPELQTLLDKIDTFNDQWPTLKDTIAPDLLKQLHHIATIESIGSSTRIEGAKLSDQAVELLLSNLNIESFKSRDEEEIAGYGYVMEEIFASYEYIPLTENYIKQLHAMLLKYSAKDIRHRGDYKKHPNNVEAFDADGKSLGIVFATSSPFDTPHHMEALVSWTNNAFNNHLLHPLIIIGTFIVVFLAIHPFQDGNGRLSRILTTLLLLKSGYSYVPYSSLETVIEHHKESYYRSLRRTQTTIATETPDFNPWLLYFLRSLQRQIDHLDSKIKREQATLASLSPLAEKILQIIIDKNKATMANFIDATNAPRSTLIKQLTYLTEQKYITRHGKGRTVWYMKA